MPKIKQSAYRINMSEKTKKKIEYMQNKMNRDKTA